MKRGWRAGCSRVNSRPWMTCTGLVLRALRTAYLVTCDQSAAEDVVHDAFVEVLQNIRALRDPANFRQWFYRIVVNKAKRFMRRRAFQALPLVTDMGDRADPGEIAPDEAIVGAEERQLLWASIEQLDELYRVPIVLRYYTELTDAEIVWFWRCP